MKKFFITLIAVLIAAVAFAQENYKLGDFYLTQVKAKSLKLGNNWELKKSSTNAGLEFYYGTTKAAAFSTTGVFIPVSLGVGVQTITQTNTNLATFNNSVKVTDTAFVGNNQWMYQKNTNGLKVEGSITVPDSVFIGSGQYLFQNHVNNVLFNNSVTATDTIFGGVVSSTGNLSATGITGSTLPTFTIASGQVIPTLLFDTIGFAVSGLTTASIVLVSYGEAVPTADTIACVYSVKTGWLTLMGENGKKINYWIPKK